MSDDRKAEASPIMELGPCFSSLFQHRFLPKIRGSLFGAPPSSSSTGPADDGNYPAMVPTMIQGRGKGQRCMLFSTGAVHLGGGWG
jgi:hypothetical protein